MPVVVIGVLIVVVAVTSQTPAVMVLEIALLWLVLVPREAAPAVEPPFPGYRALRARYAGDEIELEEFEDTVEQRLGHGAPPLTAECYYDLSGRAAHAFFDSYGRWPAE